jgi:hypothetical protein
MTDRDLTRHLGIVVVVKLLILALLWWCFARGSGAEPYAASNPQLRSTPPWSQKP